MRNEVGVLLLIPQVKWFAKSSARLASGAQVSAPVPLAHASASGTRPKTILTTEDAATSLGILRYRGDKLDLEGRERAAGLPRAVRPSCRQGPAGTSRPQRSCGGGGDSKAPESQHGGRRGYPARVVGPRAERRQPEELCENHGGAGRPHRLLAHQQDAAR